MATPSASKILLIEGTVGTGKSVLADRLIKKHVTDIQAVDSILYLNHFLTLRPLLTADGPVNPETNKNHLAGIAGTLHEYSTQLSRKNSPGLTCILETLHITQCFRPGVLKVADILSFDRQLAGLGCKLLFLKTGPENIWDYCVKHKTGLNRLEPFKNKNDVSVEEISQYLVEEQNLMEKLVGKSAMGKEIKTVEKNLFLSIEDTYAFWMK